MSPGLTMKEKFSFKGFKLLFDPFTKKSTALKSIKPLRLKIILGRSKIKKKKISCALSGGKER